VEGNLILKEEKVYVLKDEKLRVEIIWLHHNIPAARHGGRWKMIELVARNNKRHRKICGWPLFVSKNEE